MVEGQELAELERANSTSVAASVFDSLAMVGDDKPLINLEIVKTAVEEKGGHDIVAAESSLKQLLKARALLNEAKAQVQAAILARSQEADVNTSASELQMSEALAQKYGAPVADVELQGDSLYAKQLKETSEGDLAKLLADSERLAEATAEKEALYADYWAGNPDEAVVDDAFRVDLLKHLAGAIVVKEHRVRYQKEQFDRFMASVAVSNLKNRDQTLKEFAANYSRLLGVLLESSHSFRCPKIEANYDDFAEQTVKPLNATIFYYFFSSNRSGKTWAQWMLSSVRYPNDRLRRAYVRFFA